MKKTFKLILAVYAITSMAFVSCSKDEEKTATPVDVPKVNKSLVMDITALWCPPCGSYGISGFNQAVRTSNNLMIPLSVHAGDALSSTPGNELQDYEPYKTNTIPYIAVGNGLLGGVFADTIMTAKRIVNTVNDSIAGEVIVAASISNKSVDNGSLSFDVNTKFFKDVTGDYYVSAYVLEDGIIAPQKKEDGSTDSNQVHNHVLRAAATATFGDSWFSGSISANSGKTKNYKVTILPAWNGKNLHVAALIWKKVGTKYYFVNGNTSYTE